MQLKINSFKLVSYHRMRERGISGDVGMAMKGYNIYLVPTNSLQLTRMYVLRSKDLSTFYSDVQEAEEAGDYNKVRISLFHNKK